MAMAKSKSKNNKMFVLTVQDNEEKCTESQLEILMKISGGEYRLVKKNKRSTVWNVYREIARPDGTKLKWRYYCMGCKRVMQSTGGTTSNLRIHKCHVRYLKQLDPGHKRSQSPQASGNESEYKEFYDIEDGEMEDQSLEDATAVDVSAVESELSEELELSGNARPLLKFFSEESWPTDINEDQDQPIELDHVEVAQPRDFKQETLLPSTAATQIDASALAEAESYAKAWSHAFLKLNEDQKFYAKRAIDELLVLGRVGRLSISTVTALTTNL